MKKTAKHILPILLLFLLTACGQTAAPQLTLGSWEDRTYTNDYLDLTFTLPDQWYPINENGLKEMLGYDQDTQVDLLSLEQTYLMMAFDTTGNNLKILALDEPDLDSTAQTYLDETIAQLQAADSTYTFTPLDAVTINSHTYAAYLANYTFDDTAMEQLFLCTHIDTHYIILNYTTYTTGTALSILDNFS